MGLVESPELGSEHNPLRAKLRVYVWSTVNQSLSMERDPFSAKNQTL